MIWTFAGSLALGALVSVPLLSGGRFLSHGAADRAERWLTWIAFPVLAALLVWIAFRLYAVSYLRVLGGVAALPILVVLLLVLRKSPLHWRRLPQLAGILALLAFGSSEAVLARAAAGGLPAQYPVLLAEMAGPRALPGLEAALQREDPQVRFQAATELRKCGAAGVPALATVLNDSEDGIRNLASEAVSNAPQPRYLPALSGLLRDRNESIRKNARWGLSRLKDPAVVPVLIAAMALEEKQMERMDYQSVLSQMGRLSRAPLIQALSDRDEQVRIAAAESFARNGGGAVVSALINSVQHDPSPGVRATAIKTLAELAAGCRRDQVTTLISLQEGLVVFPDTSSYIDPNRVLAALAAAANDPHPTVRAAVASGIYSVFGADEMNVNRYSLDLKDPENDMTPLDTRAAISSLVTLLNDASERVRNDALYALGIYADRRAVPALIRLLQNEESQVRERAASALSAVGDPSAIPALKKADLLVEDRGSCDICKALLMLGAKDSVRHDVVLDWRYHGNLAEKSE